MADVHSIYADFIDVYNTKTFMLVESTILLQENVSHEGHSFTLQMYNAIVENCFMQIYLAWEGFLEKSFVAYLQNAPDLQGGTYLQHATPTNDEHAYNMLKGTKSYPDWTNIDDVNYLAKTYFDLSGPYAIISSPRQELLEMKTVRNRISHVSEKSIKQFNNLLNRCIAQTNISPGDFLMMFKDSNTTYFTFYVDMLKDYVDAICNK